MAQRWFTIAIGVMWFTSMGWLVSTKLWPLLQAGTPPSNLTVYTQQKLAPGEELPPIGWNMSWGGRPMGWAVSSSSVNSEGYATIRSHAHFDWVPIEELLPPLLQPLMRLRNYRGLTMEAESRLVMNAEGRLDRISFIITSPVFDKPIRVEGHVKNDKFYITFFTSKDDKFPRGELPADQVIGNDLTPLVRLPDLHLDQTWNVRVYSPFGIGKNPLEVVQAKVERSDVLNWEDTERRVWLVVLRRDSLLGRAVRGKMWVDHDGTVLQQESYIGNSKLTFTRVRDSQAKLFQQQSQELRQNRLREYDVEEFDPSSVPEDKVEVLPIPGVLSGDGTKAEPPRSGHDRHGHHGPRGESWRGSSEDVWNRAEREANRQKPAEATPVKPADEPEDSDSETDERGSANSPLPAEDFPSPASPAQP